ncbi:MAG: competence/damage-inducible protein A [bacterium]
MRIEILCTGDEILSGKTINTNYAYIARKLVERGFTVHWGTTVGDDRRCLRSAFLQASERADAVIVNGGLGPTVDDLSQEVAAEAAEVELELHQDWLDRMQAWYTSRGRKMPANNRKQAMIPAGAEFIDNPIGTACGFAININAARFFFTPGVPREMRRMVDEQIIPRLEEIRGYRQVTVVKRFHSFGIGESRADQMLAGIEDMAEDGLVKLGFQSHYPQLETKLTIQGESRNQIESVLLPIETEVRRRLGHFVVAEGDQSLESQILAALEKVSGSISIVEMHSSGDATSRLLRNADRSSIIGVGIVSLEPSELSKIAGLEQVNNIKMSAELALNLAESVKERAGTSHALVILSEKTEGDNGNEPNTDIYIAVSGNGNAQSRVARLPGSHEWMRLGSAELGLDCLRRYLFGLPVYQRIDFEQH